MTITIIRPNQHVYTLPGYGQRIIEAEASVTAADWWVVAGKTCVAAYQPKGAASYAASKVNLANPGTYDMADGVAPTWATETGWTFSGTEYLLNTTTPKLTAGFTILVRAVANITTSNSSRFCSSRNVNDSCGWGYAAEMGTNTGKTGFTFFGVADYKPNLLTPATDTVFVVRVDGASSAVWAGGSPVTFSAGTMTSPGLEGFYIGISHRGSQVIEPLVGNILAMSVYSNALSNDEVTALMTTVAAL